MPLRSPPIAGPEVETAPPAWRRILAQPWMRRGLIVAALGAIVVAGYAWWRLRPEPLPPGFAMSNGRIEATQIDIATKLAGRVQEVLVKEGDLVEAGQTLARMDVAALEAELHQADAQLAQARNAVDTARALADQRASELDLAASTLKRSRELVGRGFISAQKLDADRTQMLAAKAALVAARSKIVEAQSAVDAAAAAKHRIETELADSALAAPRAGRVQYRLAEPGEVLPAGGKVVSLLDLTDVYMTVFLAEATAGKLGIGSEARVVIDAAPQYVIPAKLSFVAAEAQFTPKTVETAQERQKLVFRVKAQLDPELLRRHETHVKAGLPGVAYVRVDPHAQWPERLRVKLPSQ